jgi:hypothetical protein
MTGRGHAGPTMAVSLSSENILGLKNMRPVSTARDLERLELKVRTADESLIDLLSDKAALGIAGRPIG